MVSNTQKLRRHLPVIAGTVFVLAVGGAVSWMIAGFLDADNAVPKKTVQKITLLTPPPPPPPPPPQKIEEPPPEPELEEEMEVPEPAAIEDLPDAGDEPPPDDALGLDADGGAGGDSFGLVGRKGGRGLLSGDPNVVYAVRLQRAIEDALLEIKGSRRYAYSVVASIWVGSSGDIFRAELVKSSGKPDVDGILVKTILDLQLTDALPPPDMRNPIRMRITSRI